MRRMTASKSVADQLREALKQAKSINSVAVAADVSEGVLRRFAQGRGITLETAERLAAALGLKITVR